MGNFACYLQIKLEEEKGYDLQLLLENHLRAVGGLGSFLHNEYLMVSFDHGFSGVDEAQTYFKALAYYVWDTIQAFCPLHVKVIDLTSPEWNAFSGDPDDIRGQLEVEEKVMKLFSLLESHYEEYIANRYA